MSVSEFISRQKTEQSAHDLRENNSRQGALLEKIGNKNQQAMRQFFVEYSDDVYSYVYSRTSDETLSADILNQVMMVVWNGNNPFTGRSKVTTWLIGIARYKLVDHYRREQKQAYDVYESHHDEPISVKSDEYENEQKVDHLKICIGRLADLHREIVHLVFYSELSCGDIAKIINCPEGTVKSRMYYAREAMKTCLVSLSGEENYCVV